MASQPSLQTIRFRIRGDGRVEETVEGLAGAACERLTEQIEARVGSLQRRQPTAEAFQSAEVLQPLATETQATGSGSSPLPTPLT